MWIARGSELVVSTSTEMQRRVCSPATVQCPSKVSVLLMLHVCSGLEQSEWNVSLPVLLLLLATSLQSCYSSVSIWSECSAHVACLFRAGAEWMECQLASIVAVATRIWCAVILVVDNEAANNVAAAVDNCPLQADMIWMWLLEVVS
jgi:hypothetical protein